MMDVDISLIMVSVDAPAIQKLKQKKPLINLRAMTHDPGRKVMSNLYMTTEEFADMVVDALHEQNYFKRGQKSHPGDIVMAFTSTAESIAAALEWAISREAEVKKEHKKQAVMRTSTLAKNTHYTDTTSSGKVTYSSNTVLPQDEEIAPVLLESGESLIPEDYSFDYSEYRWKKNS
jgi:hypothetical protein